MAVLLYENKFRWKRSRTRKPFLDPVTPADTPATDSALHRDSDTCRGAVFVPGLLNIRAPVVPGVTCSLSYYSLKLIDLTPDTLHKLTVVSIETKTRKRRDRMEVDDSPTVDESPTGNEKG